MPPPELVAPQASGPANAPPVPEAYENFEKSPLRVTVPTDGQVLLELKTALGPPNA